MRRFLGTYLPLCALLFGAWQCFAQLPMTHAGLGAPSSGGGCSQATTVNAALDGSQNSSNVTTAVCGIVSDGDGANLVGLWSTAASSAANALINWFNPGTNNLTKNGTCTFNTNASYQGDGSSCWFATGITPSTIGNGVSASSITIGICLVNNRSTNQNYVDIGVTDGSNYVYMQPLTTAFFFELNNGVFPSFTNASTLASWIAQRTNTSNVSAYKNGSAVSGSPFTDASPTVVTKAISLLALNNNGSQTDFSADSLAYAFIGNGSISPSNIRARLNTYVGAIGSDAC